MRLVDCSHFCSELATTRRRRRRPKARRGRAKLAPRHRHRHSVDRREPLRISLCGRTPCRPARRPPDARTPLSSAPGFVASPSRHARPPGGRPANAGAHASHNYRGFRRSRLCQPFADGARLSPPAGLFAAALPSTTSPKTKWDSDGKRQFCRWGTDF